MSNGLVEAHSFSPPSDWCGERMSVSVVAGPRLDRDLEGQFSVVSCPGFEPTSAPARSMILVVCVPPQPITQGSERKPKPEYEMVGIVPPQPITRGSERKPKPEYEMVGIVPPQPLAACSYTSLVIVGS